MNQIQNQNPLFGGLNGAGASASASAAANAANAARKDGTSDFSQWLNQSSQKLQTQSTDAQMQAQAQAHMKDSAPAPAPAPQAQKPAQANASSAAKDESKLAARNVAARNSANKSEGTKAPGHPANVDASKRAGAADSGDAVDTTDATQARGAADGSDTVQARDVDGKDAKTTKDPKDAKEAGATTADQILAMLRGETPAEAKPLPRGEGSPEGDQPAGDTLAGQGQAHGKRRDAGDVLRERQELQRDLTKAAGVDDGGKSDKPDALQALQGGAHEIALGDGASAAHGPQASFESLLAAAQQAGSTAGTNGADATAAAEAPAVPLSQPLDSPDFAPELSASVSLLIKDGIHEAQLQLNPADMGPVAINIQLDGQQAQVNFHAQQAATREVLERSLPDLAAALQAQGLTLSGGGVFAQQQSSGGQNRGDGSSDGSSNGNRRGGRGQGDDGAIAASGRAERRTAPRGLVDLYA